jgi:hypothetical protein
MYTSPYICAFQHCLTTLTPCIGESTHRFGNMGFTFTQGWGKFGRWNNTLDLRMASHAEG